MKFNQSLHYLGSLTNYEKFSDYNYSRAYNLDRIRKLLFYLGNPQERYLKVAIAGTKGKGSLACMLGSILSAAGIKTGVFTSPHLVSIRERIKVDSLFISEPEFAREISEVKDTAHKHQINGLTYFEVITAAAFSYFLHKKVKIAVLEAGLGGRLDAVNAAQPVIAAITPISLDHTHLLGASLKKIAIEKSGIIHNNACIVSAKQAKDALDVIKYFTAKKNAKLSIEGRDTKAGDISVSLHGTSFNLKTKHAFYRKLHTPLIGKHQAQNASVAVCLCEIINHSTGLNISEAHIRKGIGNARLPGRFQVCCDRPYIVLDGAQNKASAAALKSTIQKVFHGRDICLILGISADKDYRQIAKNLCPLAGNVIFTQAASPRAMPAIKLAREVRGLAKKGYLCYGIDDAINFARSITPQDGVIIITGSLFLVGEALEILRINNG
jgi:dihydrofolate synthase / folylpolyglutamate synthase